MLAEGSPEVARLVASRARVYTRLRELRAAGLDRQLALALLRTRTSSDYTFLARTCGIPATAARALARRSWWRCGTPAASSWRA